MKYIDAEKLIAEIRKLCSESCISESDEYYEIAKSEIIDIITSLQHEQTEVDLEKYISVKLRVLGADLINHKPYSFNRGLNVGKTSAYNDILKKINARKEKNE